MTLPIFVINLDRVPERMQAVQAQFDAAEVGGLVKRFSAIDGQADGFVAPGYAPGTWRDRWTLRVSEQAVFSSHRAIWELIVGRDLPGAVVCEDDILVSKAFGAALDAVDFTRFDIVKLDGAPSPRRYGALQPMGALRVRSIEQIVTSAGCYALSQNAARQLIAESKAFCETLDDFTFRPRAGLNTVQLDPAVAVQGVSVQQDTVPEVMTGSERGGDIARSGGKDEKGPLAYRLRKEMQRAGEKLRFKLWADKALVARGGMIGRPSLAEDLPPYT